MIKQALHALDRLRERTRLPDEAVKHLQAQAGAAEVPGGFYYLALQNDDGTHAGYAAFKTVATNSNPNKLVLATILGPNMRPKGTPLPGPLAYRHARETAEKDYGVKTAASALRKRLVPRMSTDATGTHSELTLFGKPVAAMHLDSQGNVMHAGLADDAMHMTGMGIGKKLYGETARRMPDQTLRSDTYVSPHAQRVWDSMARRMPENVSLAPGQGLLSARHTLTLPPAAAIKAAPVIPWWRRILSGMRR